MGKKEKSKGSGEETLSVQRSHFSEDNPFRRKDPPQCPAPSLIPPPPRELRLGLSQYDEDRAAVNVIEGKRKPEKAVSGSPEKLHAAGDVEESPEDKKMRKRDEVEEDYEKKRYGAPAAAEEVKAGVESLDVAPPEESFDDESKLLRTIFVGNLPLGTKRKALLKEFAKFGEIESIRIRSVPIVDSKVPKKGAIIEGKVNEAIDSLHAYIVFKEERSASASLSYNMTQGHMVLKVSECLPQRIRQLHMSEERLEHGGGATTVDGGPGLVIKNNKAIRSFLLSVSASSERHHLPDELWELAKVLSSQSSIPYRPFRSLWIALPADGRPSLRSLVEGADFVFSSPKPREKSEELKKRLIKLEELAERREYQELVKDIMPKKQVSEPFSSYKDQMGFGLHVVLIMFTGYLVGYAAFRALFNHSSVMNAAGGILGLVCGMLLETVLFILRTSNQDMASSKSKKLQ